MLIKIKNVQSGKEKDDCVYFKIHYIQAFTSVSYDNASEQARYVPPLIVTDCLIAYIHTKRRKGAQLLCASGHQCI